MRKENIRTFTLKLSEDTNVHKDSGVISQFTHILTGAVAFTPGKTNFEAVATRDCILLLNSDNGESFDGDAIARIKFKASDAVAEIGEGDNSNFREGYKTTIVLKRAEDRAAMEIIQAKYSYGLVDIQDAEIIEGQSEIHGNKPAAPPAETKKSFQEAEQEADDKFNRFFKEVKKWITNTGVAAAKQMVTSSDLSGYTVEQLKRIEEIIKNAEKIQKEIDSEKASKASQEEAKPSKIPSKADCSGATQEQIDWVTTKTSEIDQIQSPMKLQTFLAENADFAKSLPDGLKDFFRGVIADKKSKF